MEHNSPEVNPYEYSKLIFHNTKIINVEKQILFSKNDVGKIDICKKKKKEKPYTILLPVCKNGLKMDQRPSCKS